MEGDIPELLRPVSWLIGKWVSKNAIGKFPTIKDFSYNENLEFRRCGMQPLLSYTTTTTHPEKGNLMHLESGFLRLRGDGQVSFMVAHNFGNNKRCDLCSIPIYMYLYQILYPFCYFLLSNVGLTSLEEGNVQAKEIKLKTKSVTRMSGSKDPEVLEVIHSNDCNKPNFKPSSLFMT